MTNCEQSTEWGRLSVQGVGGIDSTSVTLTRGVTILEGRNATNRTSLLQAIMGVLGSNNVSLKGDCEEGHISLTLEGETYTRTLSRAGGDIQYGGNPFVADSTEADLFAFLLEANEARQAVSRCETLRDIIMRPVDTDEIERQIRELQTERADIDSRIDSLEQQRKQLPELEKRKARLESELDDAREELSEAQSELESAKLDQERRQEERENLERTLEKLNEAREKLEKIDYRLDTEREALSSARDELASKETELEELPDPEDGHLADIEERISRCRREKRTYDNRVSQLHRLVQFNKEMIEGEGDLADLFEETDKQVTDKLLGDAQTTCWTCGSSVETTEIEAMLAKLRELNQSQRQARSELETELEALTEERDTVTEMRERRETLSEQIASLEADIQRREETVESLEAEQRSVRETVTELEAKADSLEEFDDSPVPERQRAVNEHEIEIERLERERDEVIERIESLEANADEISELEEERRQISEQLTELRTRIDRLEANSVDAFNEHMDELVDLLEYENLARVWIERRTADEDGSANAENEFHLHIVRTTDEGKTYEDTVAHLSESEREVTGLVFALAGYLVHEVYETVPVMLLDSLEAIDSDRIALLVEYLADYSPAIVAALLPEDATALDDEYRRITAI